MGPPRYQQTKGGLQSDSEDTPTPPTLNGGLLSTERENGPENPTLNTKSKTSSKKPVAKTKVGPKYTKNGVMCSVVMLDGNDFEVEVPRAANGQVLVDKVCENLSLLEKDYFSCSFTVNDIRFWLDHDKKINKQIKSGPWNFKFEVKFYPTDPAATMTEDLSRFQLFLQLRRDISTEKLPCSFMTHALLGSYAAQSEFGDYDVEKFGSVVGYLKPSAPLSFHSGILDWLLDKTVEMHMIRRGQSPAEAEISFLDNAKLLAMYGVDLHRAKDSEGVDLMVGVCASGLMVYREKLRIHRFAWPKILKIAYKRNNFYIKVRPEEFEQHHNTMTFKCDSYKMAKRLWKIAVEHHAFFRLKVPEPAHRSKFPHIGSKFRYSGRTQYQIRGDGGKQAREKTATVVRTVSQRNMKNGGITAQSCSTERAEQSVTSGDNDALTTLDLKDRKKTCAVINEDRNSSSLERNNACEGSTPMYDKYDDTVLGGREGTNNGHDVENHDVVETRIEQKVSVTEDIDYDKALTDAILNVTEVNPDLHVERVEIRTPLET